MKDSLHQHSAIVTDRQLLLAELIGDLPWNYDVAGGLLSFGTNLSFRAEILGTESTGSETWLWAWANDGSNIPAKQQAVSLGLRSIGQEQGVTELTKPMVPLSVADGHTFAGYAVSNGFGKAYYRAPYDGGAAYLIIIDEALNLTVADPLQRVLTVFPQHISAFSVGDHREALREYLQCYDFKPVDRGDTLVVLQNDVEVLTATFDDHVRLSQLTGTLFGPENNDTNSGAPSQPL